MSGYQNQLTRVTVESSRYENGRLLVTGRGMKGERFEDLPWQEPHGFHSRPAKGATGYLVAPGGRRDQAVVQAAMDPKKVPEIGEGDAAMYDASGKVVHLSSGGWAFNMDVTITGKLTVSGDVAIGGKLHAAGDITSDSPDGDDE